MSKISKRKRRQRNELQTSLLGSIEYLRNPENLDEFLLS
jgi:hypothetical protein